MPSDRYPWRYAGFLTAYYLSNALYQGYVTLYLSASGLDARRIGLIMSALPLCAIAAQLMWGALSDRGKSRTRVLRAAVLLASGCMFLMSLERGFIWLIAMLSLFGACYPALQPMGDSIILEALNDKPFGPLRMSACVAFALGSLAFGYVLEARPAWFAPLAGALLLAVAALSLMLPGLPGHQSAGPRVPFRALFGLPHMKGLLALFMLLQLTMGYYFAFFPLYFTGLPGGSKRLLGLAYLIATLSELPFLLKGDRLFKRLGAGRLLLCSAAALGLRWLSLAALPSVHWVLPGQILHAGGFIVFTFAMAKFIAYAVPEELRARGQTLLAIAGYGAARVAGNLLGTWINGAFGLNAGFWCMAGVCAMALLIFASKYLKEAAITGLGGKS